MVLLQFCRSSSIFAAGAVVDVMAEREVIQRLDGAPPVSAAGGVRWWWRRESAGGRGEAGVGGVVEAQAGSRIGKRT